MQLAKLFMEVRIMDEELMQCKQELEKLEDDLLTCQREIRRLRAVVREYDCENRKLQEFILSKIQAGNFSDEVVGVLQETYDFIQKLNES